MVQATLSAANVVQAKTDKLRGDPAPIALDSPCQEGNTVTVEVMAGLSALMDGGMEGHIPAGFNYDGGTVDLSAGSRYMMVFRKPGVAAGEQSWNFTAGFTSDWHWRVTEWDQALELVSPLEVPIATALASGTAPTSLSTGNAPEIGTTSRASGVCLGWHLLKRLSTATGTVSWSGHTNGFSVRDALDWQPVGSAQHLISSWSWLFSDTASQYECTATLNRSVPDASDVLVSLLVVYAATTYG